MRMLTFQARRFAWRPCAKTVEAAADVTAGGEAVEAVVAWLHAEAADVEDRRRVFRHALKHIKWIANKRGLRHVVLHFFAHLGGESAEATFAQAFIADLAERLQSTGYTVSVTPFGYFCAWELEVYGDSLAKVYKTI
jgi:hypothetical protein